MTQAITVLGAGIVGRAIIADLCADFAVTAVDLDQSRLDFIARQYAVTTTVADLSDPTAVSHLARPADLVVCAVPGFLGFAALNAIIEAGTHVVDISFTDADPFELDEAAKSKDVIAVVDFGVAPGMTNCIAGFHDETMEVERFDCMVGGLPFDRQWPYEYKASFSPIDIIEEYVRPARLRENGVVITRPALSGAEILEVEPVGQLEAFNTDGLRTLLATTDIPNLRERTLRYPGHVELMRVLRETGFFSTETIMLGNTSVVPRDLTAALLFPLWHAGPGDRAFTVMTIDISGKEDGKPASYRYHLYDEDDATTGLTSMARTTGFTAAAAARLILDGTYSRVGISPPEYIGAQPGCLRRILDELARRNVIYQRT